MGNDVLRQAPTAHVVDGLVDFYDFAEAVAWLSTAVAGGPLTGFRFLSGYRPQCRFSAWVAMTSFEGGWRGEVQGSQPDRVARRRLRFPHPAALVYARPKEQPRKQ